MADPTPTPLVERLRAQAARHREHAIGLASAALLEEAAEALGTAAACDVLTERRRQIEVEGHSTHSDDQVGWRVLARGSIAYAIAAVKHLIGGEAKEWWPWRDEWKPKDARCDMVRSAALGIAAIECIDRAALAEKESAMTPDEIVSDYVADRPRRRIVMLAEIEADSWKDLRAELHRLESEIARSGSLSRRSLSGGYSSGHIIVTSEDGSIDHDSWAVKLDEHLRRLDAEQEPKP